MYKKLSIIFISLLNIHNAYAEPFKVGVILPLSGPVAPFGEAAKSGLEMSGKENTESVIEYIFEDSRYDPKTSITAFNKLSDIDKPNLIISWGTGPSGAIAPIAEARKTPTILISGDPEINKNKKYVIDFVNNPLDFSKTQIDFIRGKGHKKIAVIKTEIQYLEAFLKSIQNNLQKDESINIIDSFQPDSSVNFQTAITKIKVGIKQGNIDVLAVLLGNGQVGSFYKKMAEQKILLPTFGSDVLSSKAERTAGGSAITGATFAGISINDNFKAKFDENNSDQIAPAANSYDLASLLNDLFSEDYRNNKKLTPKEILSRIESVKERDGVSGKYYFTRDNPEGDPVGGKRFKFPIVIKEVTEGGGERVIQY
jgi:ABC-type branched-subunit amino acid transport system substrate-binding protein